MAIAIDCIWLALRPMLDPCSRGPKPHDRPFRNETFNKKSMNMHEQDANEMKVYWLNVRSETQYSKCSVWNLPNSPNSFEHLHLKSRYVCTPEPLIAVPRLPSFEETEVGVNAVAVGRRMLGCPPITTNRR